LQQELLGKVLIKPKYGKYAMKQAILFECFDKSPADILQATMAEHIFSRVAHSYVTSGGFNSISGGTSISSARSLPEEAYDARIPIMNHGALLRRIRRQITDAEQELKDDETIKDGQKLRAEGKRLKDAYDDGEIALANSKERLHTLEMSVDEELAKKLVATRRFVLAVKEQHMVKEKMDEVISLMESMVASVKKLADMNIAA